jgi:hypothetical protein
LFFVVVYAPKCTLYTHVTTYNSMVHSTTINPLMLQPLYFVFWWTAIVFTLLKLPVFNQLIFLIAPKKCILFVISSLSWNKNTVVPLYNAALYSAVCFIRRVCHGPRFLKTEKTIHILLIINKWNIYFIYYWQHILIWK